MSNASGKRTDMNGYHKTSIGWIPKDWTVHKFSKLAEFKNGLNYLEGEQGYQIKVIGVQDFQDKFLISYDALNTVCLSNPPREADFLRNGDLLFVRSNGSRKLIGRVLLIKNVKEPISHSGFTIRARLITSDVIPEFVGLFLKSFPARKQIFILGGGTNISNLSQEILGVLDIPIPRIPEQKRICKIIDNWDKAIEQTEKLITAKTKLKRGLMKQLLTGKKRFPDFQGQGWIKVSAGEIFKNVSVKGNKNEELLSATQGKGIIPRSMLEARVTMPKGDTNSFKLVEAGDFVISLRSFQGGLEYSYYRGVVSPAYTVLKSKKKINAEFYKQYYKSYEFIGRLATAVIGIRDGKQISYEDYCLVKIPFPSFKEQERIAEVLNACDKAIELLTKQCDALKEQKRGLMQKLLTGQIRVKVDEQAKQEGVRV